LGLTLNQDINITNGGTYMRLENKVAVVTGCSSGIGRAIALQFAKEGADVVAVARRKERLDEISEMAKKDFTGSILPYKADVTKKEEIEAALECAVKEFGQLNILVDCAGLTDNFVPIGDCSDEHFFEIFNTNLYAAFYSCRKAVNIMLEQGKGGSIINVSSLGGITAGRAGGVSYHTSKYALIGLTKNLAHMYMPKNIRCNVICPGLIQTEMSDKAQENKNEYGFTRAGVGWGWATVGEPDDIGLCAVYMASDESKFMSGSTVVVDGGWGAY
jgi:NAD(P)-dependent dehydrogenase (short-subunit alcohol dehydrogenase family)